AQVFGQLGDTVPDVDDAAALRTFFDAVQSLNRDGRLLAYHDRSDGGLFAAACEMAFAARWGLVLELDALRDETTPSFFAEELGAVARVPAPDVDEVAARLAAILVHRVRAIALDARIQIVRGD